MQNRIASPQMRVLLAGIFAFHAGWYMLLPYFAVLFTTRRGLSAGQAGLVLAAQSFTVLIGSVAGGYMADRFGRTKALVLGLVLRAAGLGLLGFAATLGPAIAASVLAGLGGGVYGPAAKAAISVLADDEHRTAAFAWRGIAANVGVSLGPVAGALLVRGSMPVLFAASAAVHGAVALLTWTLPADKGAPVDRQVKSPWRDILSDVPYLLYSLVTVLAWGLFSQLAIAVPLYASRVLGLEALIGLLWTMSSLVVIALQVPVSRYLLARINPLTAMAAGVVLLGGGLGLAGFARSFYGLLAAVLVFVAGEMLMLPTTDTVVSGMAPEGALASYFGVSSFAWGLGDGLGSLLGGALMATALGTGRLWLPWAIYAAIGAGAGVLFMSLRVTVGRRLTPQPPEKRQRVQLFRPGNPTSDESVLLGPTGDDDQG